ncbi:hypothetical protein SGM_2000 [Streptomyces griseoaurantiacus M045]|uniref:Uncharacterized protein n=1 Tax=Streptomyces griseoaurantiacus M045 TaxID=996637 RepID=F3NFT6_9ACTN|nr:hypothetical protein SGM_2000 [Streptomyces griseoaurantiacus M045]
MSSADGRPDGRRRWEGNNAGEGRGTCPQFLSVAGPRGRRTTLWA